MLSTTKGERMSVKVVTIEVKVPFECTVYIDEDHQAEEDVVAAAKARAEYILGLKLDGMVWSELIASSEGEPFVGMKPLDQYESWFRGVRGLGE